MNKMIEYQEIDSKLRAIEMELRGSEERKRAKAAQAFLGKVDEVAARLDKRASDLNGQYNDINNVYQQRLKEVKEFTGVADGLEEHKEVEYIVKKVEKTMNEIRRLEIELAELSKDIEATLTEFSDLKKKVKLAKDDFTENRAKYEAKKAERQPEMDKLKLELTMFEKNVDRNLLAKYKKKREEKIFPVFVPAVPGLKKGEQRCGGCQMLLSLAAGDELNSKKLIECEECKRYIYVE